MEFKLGLWNRIHFLHIRIQPNKKKKKILYEVMKETKKFALKL